MYNNLYLEFFSDKPEFEAELNELDNKFSLSLVRKLQNLKNRGEFLAQVIECRFGLFFSEFAEDLKHEFKVFEGLSFTPDWTVAIDNQLIVAEVLKLNPSKKDSSEMQLSDEIMNVLQTLPGDFVAQLDYDYDDVAGLKIDYDNMKEYVAKWLSTNPSIGEILNLFNCIEIELVQKGVGVDTLCMISPFRPIKYDYRRLAGDNSQLISKLKYAEAVEKFQLPYLICIHLSFESWFDTDDLYMQLFGKSGVFHDDFPFGEFYPGAEFHSYADGLYYSNEVLRQSVSGIIVYHQNQFSYFPNFNIKNRLSNSAKKKLNHFLYKELNGQ